MAFIKSPGARLFPVLTRNDWPCLTALICPKDKTASCYKNMKAEFYKVL